ncbi:unnamed protein product [Leptidea sinapis]|uniref:Copper type II ascorbate-dependent monooxygenase N-terminal domain-containing protein n=1 Tax=Leptidea sinapis TaxID=189913 RepID=A0A5E4PWJ4_9NEOP|nr:unnamed protein product [Leptidea sinapis]
MNSDGRFQSTISEKIFSSTMDELYLCTPIRIAPTQKFYIVGFKPNATMNTAHHMLLYGCTEPGSNDSVCT